MALALLFLARPVKLTAFTHLVPHVFHSLLQLGMPSNLDPDRRVQQLSATQAVLTRTLTPNQARRHAHSSMLCCSRYATLALVH